jgi:ABC-type uncharacterized transport system permease subunit
VTAATPAMDEVVPEVGTAARQALRASRIRGGILVVLGLFALQLAIGTMTIPATFSLWIDHQGGTAATLTTTVGVLWILTGVATGTVGMVQLVLGPRFAWRRALLVLLPLWILATLAALLSGKAANLTNLFTGTLAYAIPISLGAFAGILSERSGILNIAIEGKFLVGACVASIAASVSGQAIVGVAAAAFVAALMGLLLAWLGIRWKVDQIIIGVVINIGAVGIANFLFLRILQHNTALNTPPTVGPIRIPILADIPILGPILFDATPYASFTYVIMLFFAYMLFRTRWGLRLRAAGEKPSAAGTVGIDVLKIRYRALLLAGVLAGIAGSYLSLSTAGSFQLNMSAGRGFIALAAVIFGAWNPIFAFGAALVFGFADSAQTLLSILGVDVPPQLLNSVPYLVTIIVVAGVVGRVRGPAAAGQPYEQG